MPVVIENPVLNSPYEEPQRHFRFAEDGITDEIVGARALDRSGDRCERLARSRGCR